MLILIALLLLALPSTALAQLRLQKVGCLRDDFRPFADETYRSVQLKIPLIYAMDRDGDLHVFRLSRHPLPEVAIGFLKELGSPIPAWLTLFRNEEVRLLKSVVKLKNAGDGNDLEIVGNRLLLTSRGRLAVYSIDEPSKPSHIVTLGNADQNNSQSIVRSSKSVFILGKNQISAFEVSDDNSRHIATFENNRRNWNGHLDGKSLYVSEWSKERTGVAVYDASDPAAIVEKHFLATPRVANHVFMNRDRHLICCIDSESRFHSVSSDNITVSGTAMIYQTVPEKQPKLVATIEGAGGRTAIAFPYGRQTVLLCNGVAFESKSEKLTPGFKFFPDGSTLDGAPYGCDHYGRYSVVTTDHELSIFRIGEPFGFAFGKRIAMATKFIANQFLLTPR